MKEVYKTIPVYGNEPNISLDPSEITSLSLDLNTLDERFLDPRTIQSFEIGKNQALKLNTEVLNKISESMGLEELPKAIRDFNTNNNPEIKEIITEVLSENGKFADNNEDQNYQMGMNNGRKMNFNR